MLKTVRKPRPDRGVEGVRGGVECRPRGLSKRGWLTGPVVGHSQSLRPPVLTPLLERKNGNQRYTDKKYL